MILRFSAQCQGMNGGEHSPTSGKTRRTLDIFCSSASWKSSQANGKRLSTLVHRLFYTGNYTVLQSIIVRFFRGTIFILT